MTVEFYDNWEKYLATDPDRDYLSVAIETSRNHPKPNMQWLNNRLMMHLARFKPDSNSDGWIKI